MIKIPLSPEDFAVKSRELAQKHGIALTGYEGTLSKSGVTAGYHYDKGMLTINILDKPFFVTTDYCETQLKKFLA